MKKNHYISITLIVFLLVGCGTPAGNNGYITPQQISDPKIAEITPTFETQIERVNNCDGANPTYNIGYKTVETQKATFEVSVEAGGLVTGTPVPTILEVQLEAKIAAALAKDYGLTTEKSHDMTLENPQGKFLEHTIEWKVTRVKGLIDVIYGDGVAQVAFDKIANVELYNRTSKSLGCNESVSNSPPTPTVSSPPVNSGSSVYDDFNNSEFNGKINPSLWSVGGYSNEGKVYQQDGVLVLSDIANSGSEGFILALKNWKETNFSSFQAKVKLSSEHTGNEGNITLNADSWTTHDIPGNWAEFGIGYQGENSARIHTFFGDGSGSVSVNAKYDTWYTLRVEFDNGTNTFSYFIDDQLFSTHTLPNPDGNIQFKPAIQLWHKNGTSVNAYIDDVIVRLKK
jgi:hypothetical protein